MAGERQRSCAITAGALALVLLSLAVFAYLRSASLKKSLLSALSARATTAIGQPVAIEDISFQFPGRLRVCGVTVDNPRGFAPGKLLRIKRITLDMRLEALLSHNLHFSRIEVDSPTVTILRDKKGRLNVSGLMRRLFSGESGAPFQVDSFGISSGILSVNKGEKMSAKKIDLVLQNLSSRPDIKMTARGGLLYAGNRIRIEGWAYPGEKPGQFRISVSAEDFSPALFAGDLNKYKIDTKKARLDIHVEALGDTGKGIEIKSVVRVKSPRSVNLPLASHITLTCDSFLDVAKESLVIKDLSLNSGGISEARLKGVITNLGKGPKYSASLKIEKFDLRAVNFIKGAKFAGVLTSGDLRIKGRMKGGAPEVSGELFLNNASVMSSKFEAKKVDAKVILSWGRKSSFTVQSMADINVGGKYSLEKPARIRLSLHGRGRPARMTISSSAVLSPFEMNVNGKNFQVTRVSLQSVGLLTKRTFSGKGVLEMGGIVFGGRKAGSLVIRAHADVDNGMVELKGANMKNEHFTANVRSAKLRTSAEKAGYRLDISDLTANYAAESAGIEHLNISVDLSNSRRVLSGSFGLSAERIIYGDIAAGSLAGSGSFDDETFEADFHLVDIWGGGVKCVMNGRTKEGYFPLRVTMSAEKIDMSAASKALVKFVKMPCRLSGGMGSFSFEGTFNARDDLTGISSLRLKSFSVSRLRDGRSLVRGADLAGRIAFAGKALDFTGNAVIGKVAVHARGHIRDFMTKGRNVEIGVDIPPVKAVDMRESFWGIFPDALLYTGLEGSLSAAVSAHLRGDSLTVDGGIALKDFVLTGENGEYSIGPVNGTIPLTYRRAVKSPDGAFPTFQKSEFAGLRRYYKNWKAAGGFTVITAGSFSYGFRLLDNIKVRVRPENGFLNIGKLSANIFGGTLEGSAVIGLSGAVNYRAGFIVDGLSLTKLCDDIGPIKGYISGKADGIADIKSAGEGVAGIIGKADVWTYSTEDEKTMISKEFLRKVGGPAVKTYLGDRRFDKGVMDLYIQKGFLIFKDLDISHRNFLGIKDLSIKVAPFNNRIRIADLLWSIAEAAQRAKRE